MQTEAIVLQISNGRARCEGVRKPACGDCGADSGCGIRPRAQRFVFEAEDPIGVRPGARVIVELPDRVVLAHAWRAYGAPAFGLVLGALLGAIAGDLGAAWGAALGLVLGWRWMRSAAGNPRPRIVRVLEAGG